jgi:hypothetical protein
VLAAPSLLAQPPDRTRDSVNSLVTLTATQLARAAERFFDTRLATADRVAAVRDVNALPAQDAARAFDLAFDTTAPLEIRTTALRLASRRLIRDSSAQQTLFNTLLIRDTALQPLAFRRAAMHQLQLLLVARPATNAEPTLRTLTSDSDPDIRNAAITRLAMRGDPASRQRLIDGIRQPQRAVLPEAEALGVLAPRPDSAVIALAQELLTTRPDGPTRTIAARIAAGAETGRRELFRLLGDARTSTQLRIVALQALIVYDAAAIARATAPIVTDESASDSLRVAIIEALRHRPLTEGSAEAAALRSRIDQVNRTTRSTAVRAAATRFLDERS